MPTITQDTRPYDSLVATNRFINPRFGGTSTPISDASTSAVGLTIDSGNAVATFTASATTSSRARLAPNADRCAAVAGQTWYASVRVKNASAGSRSLGIRLVFYDTAGATTGTVLQTSSSTPVVLAAGADAVVTLSGVAPSGTASVGVIAERNSGTGAATGDIVYSDDVYLGLENVAQFTGATANTVSYQYAWTGSAENSTSTKKERNPNTAPVDPAQILGYNVTRKVRTTVHDILGSASTEATLQPAGLRSGTIEYLFATAAEAARCEAIHSNGVSTITMTGNPVFGTMKYVPQGEVNIELEMDSTTLYVVRCGFQEIAA